MLKCANSCLKRLKLNYILFHHSCLGSTSLHSYTAKTGPLETSQNFLPLCQIFYKLFE